jgi:putative endopeptidase
VRHNGKLVTGEAMGDLNGIRIAYDAFLGFARVWAGTVRPEATQRQLATDPHALWKYRVDATLQNMPEFHRAFACKRGDPMVRPPDQQCRLW